MRLYAQIATFDGTQSVETKALIDSGAQGLFIDKDFVIENNFPTLPLRQPIIAMNVDGTRNKRGEITHYTVIELTIQGHQFKERCLVTGLGKDHLILGLPWLRRVNPDIDWGSGTCKIRKERMKKPIRYKFLMKLDIRRLKKIRKTERTEQKKTEQGQPDQMKDSDGTESEEEKEEARSDPEDEDLLIAYIRGEPTIGIFKATPSPLTDEHTKTEYTCIRRQTLSRFTQEKRTLRYIPNQNVWIRAKTSVSQTLEHQKKDNAPPKTLDELLPEELKEYREVFEKEASERFPPSRPWDHAIDLKPDFVPRNCSVYHLGFKEKQEMDKFIDENLDKGYIRPSKSPQASPFFFVAKKEEGALRPCQDYRYLNNGTIKNAYPLPLVSDLIDKLGKATIFTKLDIRWGYHNIRIKKGDEWKAAFRTHRGLYEPLVMFFGLCNSPATFQAMMNQIFNDYLAEGWLVIYMDDMLVFSTNQDDQTRRTKLVLERLREHSLFLKAEKCKFNVPEVEFLGVIIKPGEVHMDPTKLKGIKDWQAPQDVSEVRKVLGFMNFYRRFIPNYANKARPLNDLLKKNLPFAWKEPQETAFQALKQEFAKQPVLRMPDPLKPFTVECDASKWATGAVLRQKDENGDWHPCGYISHSFSPAERNYQIYDRELLAIIRALDAWRHYLLGSPHEVTVFTDHKNLTYFRSPQKLNPRQARWSLQLSQYNLNLVHVPGRQMVQSDALSRRPDHIPEGDTDNEDMTMLPETLFLRALDTDLQAEFLAQVKEDDFFGNAVEMLKKKNTPIRSALEDWETRDDLLFYKGRCYVPKSEQLRRQIIQQYHDHPTAGHPGVFKTTELISKDYWWPRMQATIKNYVEGCGPCQQMKVNTHPTAPALSPIKSTATRPFQMVSVDFITDLPEVNGFDTLMVVVDHGLSKGVIFIPCMKTIDALGTADLFIKHVYRRFGLPDYIISDRGPQFASKVFKEMGRLLGVTLAMTTAYHPQADGETERVNQDIGAYLRLFCSNNPEKWLELIAVMEFSHNNRIHAVTTKSPFYLMNGFEPRSLPTAFLKTNLPSVEDRMAELTRARDEALAAHELARRRMAERIRSNFKPFQQGDQVWLDSKNLKLNYFSKKFTPRREGPFKIKEVLGPLTYRLELPKTWKIHPVFHATLLTPYKETEAHGPNYTKPPPDLINQEEEWEVEEILAHKRHRGRLQYKIKWKGYPTSENSWEPAAHLSNAKDILNKYKKRKNLRRLIITN
jgi:hypothetical protein